MAHAGVRKAGMSVLRPDPVDQAVERSRGSHSRGHNTAVPAKEAGTCGVPDCCGRNCGMGEWM